MEKINIAEILKDCPEGTKLYSPLCGECTLFRIDNELNRIIIAIPDGRTISFNQDGTYLNVNNAECLLFPSKENGDWSTFQQPFKNGDIIYVETYEGFKCISIFKEYFENEIHSYVDLNLNTNNFYYNLPNSILTSINRIKYKHLATEEEKQKLFDAIKVNGYKWNEETKTLEKLIVPKFKVGDRIKSTISPIYYTIVDIKDDAYSVKSVDGGFLYHIVFENEINYELIPNKFDISTLKPFDKVLVRTDIHSEIWSIDFFGYYNAKYSYKSFIVSGGNSYQQCIPYEGNEHLLGTTKNCDEYYKNW